MIETVKKHCKHSDCKYRGTFDGQPSCHYMLITGKPRACSISECDKYEAGKVKTTMTLGDFVYVDE